MTAHSLEVIRERAALHALGILPGAVAAALERHVAEGCTVCAAEVQACTAVATDLARATPPLRPPDALRDRVLACIQSGAVQVESVVSRFGLLFLRSAALEWEPVGAHNILRKLLFHDAQRGCGTQLVRMRPGATYPDHRHAGVEELYLLEGDLEVSGVRMRAGDYCRAEPGTVHRDIRSPSGCVFIAVASDHDELMA